MSTSSASTQSTASGGFIGTLAFIGKVIVFCITGGFAYPNVFIGGTAADLAPGETKESKKH